MSESDKTLAAKRKTKMSGEDSNPKRTKKNDAGPPQRTRQSGPETVVIEVIRRFESTTSVAATEAVSRIESVASVAISRFESTTSDAVTEAISLIESASSVATANVISRIESAAMKAVEVIELAAARAVGIPSPPPSIVPSSDEVEPRKLFEMPPPRKPDVEMSGNEIPRETDATTLQPVVDDVLGSTEDVRTPTNSVVHADSDVGGENSPDVIVMSPAPTNVPAILPSPVKPPRIRHPGPAAKSPYVDIALLKKQKDLMVAYSDFMKDPNARRDGTSFCVIHGYEWFTELESPSSCLSGLII
ncbi:hypothetical protein PHJA_001128000 [Phtheirospermum japonicum]|uniref:Uncharacterized protein n=1 Tax=Phtheirospermum japonicum TaxID=374723 RepID=A0A830BV18_9LAMI|nr:hypothetical protein PHJA_001128000 [Phtheirospermum japonicum]